MENNIISAAENCDSYDGKIKRYRRNAAVCFGVHAINEILMLISLLVYSEQYVNAVNYQSFMVGSIITSGLLIAGYILLTLGSVSRKYGQRLLFAGFSINLLWQAYRLVDSVVMLVRDLPEITDITESIPDMRAYILSLIFCAVNIAAAAVMLFILLAAMSGRFSGRRYAARELWFVPAVLAACTRLYELAGRLSDLRSEKLPDFAFSCLLTFAYAAALLLTARWTAFPRESEASAGERAGDCLSMVGHVLLLLFTFGIWQLIWIYRTTARLNRADGEVYRSPVKKLLLCMFVPFYYIFWTYVSAKRIDRAAARKDIPSGLTVMCTILAIFAGIVPPILMQEKINEIVECKKSAAR